LPRTVIVELATTGRAARRAGVAVGALTRFPELAGIGVQVTHGFGAVDLLRREEPGTTGLDTRSADGPFEGPVLAQPSTQLSDRLMIGRAPPVITLVALDSRSSRTLPLTLLSGRPLLDPSLRAARSTGHRNPLCRTFGGKKFSVATSSPINRA